MGALGSGRSGDDSCARLPKQEAETAVGAPCEASAIAAASKLLLDGWRERRRAVTLVWPYGGASVEVAGDVLGGWHCRAPLACSAQGCSVQIRVRARPAGTLLGTPNPARPQHTPRLCAALRRAARLLRAGLLGADPGARASCWNPVRNS